MPEAMSLLRRLPRYAGSSVVFWENDGEFMRNVQTRFRDINGGRKTRRDLGFRCHDLRHRWAVMELRAGRDLYEISKHLGHSSLKVTEACYLSWIGQEAGRDEEAWAAQIASQAKANER